jgi:alkylation response protein AidB-like acyl-CoA dehydrogenase
MAAADAYPLDRLLDAVRALEPLIRAQADEAEQQRRLPQPVVTALAEAGLFRMYTPHTLGGLEVDPLTFYRVVEALARIDGSTAWCVWIASGNPVYVGRCLTEQGAEAVFGRDPHVVTAGVVAPYGRAVAQDGGYLVCGRWPYASGCHHCTWLFCCCTVGDGDQMRLTARGDPEVRVLFVPISQVTIMDTWEVSGLAGTGSHDVVIEEVFVPEAYSGIFGAGPPPDSTHFQGLLYRYPFILASALPIGALALGIAQGAVETVMELAQTKQPVGATTLLREHALFHVRLAEAVALVRSARAWLYAAVQQTWEAMRTRAEVTVAERADVLLAGANATRSAAAAVDLVYTAAGATANYRRSPLQRALRDIHAVTQHIATAPSQYESAGRMLVGLPPLQSRILL